MNCTLCEIGTLIEVPRFGNLPRVTSDCRPWPDGGRIGCCDACGGVQKPIDTAYRSELGRIYDGYVMYAQSGGEEQQALDSVAGSLNPRSAHIVDAFASEHELGRAGSWLDIGCGNGATLRAVSQRLPGWRLVGTELDDRNRDRVEAIAGVERLHTGDVASLDDSFDVISLVHVLEHVENPSAFLASLRRLLRPRGLVLIESPLATGNAFDLVIADHITHFDQVSLGGAIARAGLHYVSGEPRFLGREVCAVAALERPLRERETGRARRETESLLELQIDWLLDVAERIRGLQGERIGIFGSSIGATFAYAVRGDIGFFVDEDPNRIGRSHLNVEILSPDSVAAGTPVFVPLPTSLADTIVSKHGRGSWLAPPPPTAIGRPS